VVTNQVLANNYCVRSVVCKLPCQVFLIVAIGNKDSFISVITVTNDIIDVKNVDFIFF